MLVVGLTGGIGSGKSAASAQFEILGRPIIDADIVAREVVEPGEEALATIVEKFGAEILTAEGNLDRARLREAVFSNTQSREWLEKLLHPIIRNRIIKKIESYQGNTPFVILASPLLLETDQYKMADHIIVIDLPESQQIQRAANRDNNDEAQIKRIMAAQLSRRDRLDRADTVIDNSSTLEHLNHQVNLLDVKLCALAGIENKR